MRYPVNIERDGNGYLVTFPDVPEAITDGDTREEALNNALDALITALDFYFEDNRPIPLPSATNDDDDYIVLPLSITAKVLLLNEWLKSGITQAELGRRIGVQRQEVTRIFNLHHTTKIDTIEKAFNTLGKQLTISLN